MIDFATARREIQSKDHSLRDKRVSARDAAALVKDGDHLAIGGCLYSRTPIALLWEILRRRHSNLTLSRSLMCYEGDLFVVAGAARRVVTSWFGIGLPWGVSRILRQTVEAGTLQFEEWSHLSLGMRYRAASMGVPFLPTLSMLGSDLISRLDVRIIEDPFTGHTVCLVPALFPDVAVIHVHRADMFGNAQIDGYVHMDVDIAKAARIVLLSAEEIVSSDRIRNAGDSTAIPFFVVDAVVEAPNGSFPHECYGLYAADMESIDSYGRAVSAAGVAATERYLQDFVFGPTSFNEYLDRFGDDRIERQRHVAADLLR